MQLRPEPPSTGRFALRVVTALVLFSTFGWAGCVGLLKISESQLVFAAGRSRPTAPLNVPQRGRYASLNSVHFNSVRIATDDGLQLHGVTLSAAHAPASRYWVLFCMPAGGSIYRPRVQGQLQSVHEFGYDILAFDYRGFGMNDGVPTEEGVYRDAVAAYEYLTGSLGVPPSRVILAGRSLGSAVAVEVATRAPSAGLVLFSPIDSVPDVGARNFPWVPVRYLASNRFDSILKIGNVRVPVLVVHGQRDGRVPIEAGRALFRNVVAPKMMLETSGRHNDAGFEDVSALGDAMTTFWPAARAADVSYASR